MDRRTFLIDTVYGTAFLAATPSLFANDPFGSLDSHPFVPRYTTYDCELLVNGGSSAGTAAALTAGRLGIDTIWVMRAPRDLGGLPTNGLNPDSDMAVRCIGGFSMEIDVLGRVATGLMIEKTKYVAPPHVIFNYFREEFQHLPNVTILADYYPASVEKDQTEVKAVVFRHRKDVNRTLTVRAKLTIDAEIEGDTAYLAGVEMTLKREGRAPSKEPTRDMEYSAGEIYTTIRGALGGGDPLPQSTFKADKVPRTMGWSGLLVLERHAEKSPDNPWLLSVPPAGYNPEDYRWVKGIGGVALGDNFHRFSMDQHSSYIEGWQLSDGRHVLETMNIADREAIERKHQARLLCILYYAQHELGHTHWGLSTKTFNEGLPPKYTLADYGTSTNAGNLPLPSLIYMREGRRMVNDNVFGGRFMEDRGTEALYQKDYWHPRSFYFNAMNIDIHAVTNRSVAGSAPEGLQVPRFINPNFGVCCIPFDVCIPRPNEATGLLVASAGAYTHQAYSAFPRMEPGRFQIGEGCAYAAQTALRTGAAPHEIDLETMQLLGLVNSGHSIVYFDDAMPGTWGHTVDQMLGARGVPLQNAQGSWIAETAFTNREALQSLENLFVTYAEKPLSERAFMRGVKRIQDTPDELATWHGAIIAISQLTDFHQDDEFDTLMQHWYRAGYIQTGGSLPPDSPIGFHAFKRLLFNRLYAAKSPDGSYPIETGPVLLRDTFNRVDESLLKPEIGSDYLPLQPWLVRGGAAVPADTSVDSILSADINAERFSASCDLFLDQTQTNAGAGFVLFPREGGDTYRYVFRTEGFDIIAALELVRGESVETLLTSRLKTKLRGFTLRVVRAEISLRCAIGHEFIGNAPLQPSEKIGFIGLYNEAGCANLFNNFEIVRRDEA